MPSDPIDNWNVARANLFTLIRYVLVVMIVIKHGYILCGATEECSIDLGTCVDCFFIISGYWATYSYVKRGSIREFYCRRAMRIFPEYWAVVLFGLLIGMAFTTLPITEFFSSSQTWKYLAANLSTLNALCPDLPGLFFDNPYTAVNGSLWFVKIVVAFYLLVPFISRRDSGVADFKLLLLIYLLAYVYCEIIDWCFSDSYSWLQHQLPGVMMYFVAGMCALKFFPWLIRHKAIVCIAAVLLFWADEARYLWLSDSAVLYKISLYLRPVAYTLAIFIFAYGYGDAAKRLSRLRDYSYGLFLFHFPLFQIVIDLGLPQFRNL